MKDIWSLLSALLFVLSAFCSPPGSSCPIPAGHAIIFLSFPVTVSRVMESIKEKLQSL